MSIQPFIKCSNISESLAFYSTILDFDVVLPPDPDPEAFMSSYAYLEREGSGVHLSAHSGDGVFGNVIYIHVADIDALYKTLTGNGLKPQEEGSLSGITIEPVEQTWGMKEFSVSDPDGNKITFGQKLVAAN